eukprot:m.203240 g.203240  ORF g.203240 m.203240 type:complete len:626 (-) comp15759_c2_seq2:1848-3725(-)
MKGKLLWGRLRDIVAAQPYTVLLDSFYGGGDKKKNNKMSCKCMKCSSRKKTSASATVQDNEDDCEGKGEADSLAEYEALIVNAGLSHERSHLLPVLAQAGLDSTRIKSMDSVLVWDYLRSKHVSHDSCMELVNSAKLQVDVLFLQGSASYLMSALGLDGKIYKKTYVMELVNKRLNDMCTRAIARGVEYEFTDIKAKLTSRKSLPESINSRIQNQLRKLQAYHTRLIESSGDVKELDLELFCNLMIAKLFFSSSGTPSTYVYSQRVCMSRDGTNLHTQLWAGYAARVLNTFFDETQQNAVNLLIVDVGAGQVKPFLITAKRGEAFRLVLDCQKDYDCSEYLGKKLSETMVYLRAFSEKHPNPSNNLQQEAIAVLKNTASLLAEKLIGSADAALMTHEGLAPNATMLVHFMGTSTIRKFLSQTCTHEAQMMKFVLLEAIRKNIEIHYCKESKHVRGENVKFVVLAQDEEAMYEHESIRNMIKYAVDIPIDLQRGRLLSWGNLSWGRGSTQGWIFGAKNGKCLHKPLALQLGLARTEDILTSEFRGYKHKWNLDVSEEKGKKTFMLFPSTGWLDVVNSVCGPNMTPAYIVIKQTMIKLKQAIVQKAHWLHFNEARLAVREQLFAQRM